ASAGGGGGLGEDPPQRAGAGLREAGRESMAGVGGEAEVLPQDVSRAVGAAAGRDDAEDTPARVEERAAAVAGADGVGRDAEEVGRAEADAGVAPARRRLLDALGPPRRERHALLLNAEEVGVVGVGEGE